MSHIRTVHLTLSWAECKTQCDGSVRLTIGGATEGGASHKVVLTMGPSTIGYLAQDLHRAVAELQRTLDEVKARLRGG